MTALLDLLGASLVLPILAPLLLRESGGMFAPGTPETTRAWVLGLLMGAFPLAQFLGAPMMGALSDRTGRRRVLRVTVLVATLGYVLCGLAVRWGNVPLLLGGRLVAGLMGGNIAIVQALVADLSAPEERARHFGLISAAGGLGFIIGPVLGGWLADASLGPWFDFAMPFWGAAALMALNLALVWFGVPETLTRPEGSVARGLGATLSGLRGSLSSPRVRALLAVVGVMTLGWPIYVQFFPVYLIQRFGADPRQIGQLFAYVGVWMVLTQLVILRWASRRWTSRALFPWCLLGLALIYPLLLWPQRMELLLLLLPFQVVFEGLAWPSAIALASQAAGTSAQGRVLGAMASVRSLGMAVAPVVSGFIVRFHPALPTLFASAVMFLAFLGAVRVLGATAETRMTEGRDEA
ncbi:MFS transporter [Hyalangium rubrum]|uniref:MFS transporter n=1 Tax=Hyalangium rubrum TaxID=3103134 RepID=A0ABU5H0J1_9BACT|nr:MFS transporter [Hyalangium sp. s54d21]MDY7226302.1 MFS transporter [Hyalangium sp. s54d21]